MSAVAIKSLLPWVISILAFGGGMYGMTFISKFECPEDTDEMFAARRMWWALVGAVIGILMVMAYKFGGHKSAGFPLRFGA